MTGLFLLTRRNLACYGNMASNPHLTTVPINWLLALWMSLCKGPDVISGFADIRYCKLFMTYHPNFIEIIHEIN